MDVSASSDVTLGADELSYGFDGYLVKKWHQGPDMYGKEWHVHDIVGCLLDLNDRTISNVCIIFKIGAFLVMFVPFEHFP